MPGAHRSRVVVSSCAAAACLLLTVAACGTAASETGGHTPAAAPLVSLDVTIYPAGMAGARHFTLLCDPGGGTVPDPAAACARLLTGPGLFAPPGGHTMCPMILAGTGRAVVRGTYLGKRVNETITDGGCDLQRWVELNRVVS